MTHQAIARLLLATLCALQGVGTIAADMNRTHATNPLWTGHARFHVIWQTGTIVLLSGLELFLLYSSLLPQESGFYLVAVLAGLPMVSFFSVFFTRPLFGSTLSDPNGIRPVELTLGGKKLCIEMNTVVEFVAFLVLAGIVTLYRSSAQ